MLNLHEMFASLQGEGPHTGRPAFFIRLAGCVAPLCPWCDTKGAWEDGTEVSVENLLDAVKDSGHRFVVITGGEPLRQWDAGLCELDTALAERGIAVQYETSGKVPVPEGIRGEVILSPKYLDGSWHVDRKSVARAGHLKFVASEETLPVIDAFVADHALEKERVWLMPLGMTRDDQIENMPVVWDHCVKMGYRMASRLHILAFDTKKGI
ncbi:7-carboxy-7-deazaguanine synthase QueE [Desulfoluna spongiiphila]|uniref:7-carboxy-7-deazaguanine synthase n=1 Tax=Desulfoluna spongiiphila TaxID=419481 RepID=A0A1G5FXN0_9BACT|nr:7-carboxy-7-deazaguanine synthase QueE [Desulfoluna spongiiphila]SCY43600.1 7-carboxy-7-deazaguanine synthase [Desulfoluna spongiiphila]